MCVILRGFWRGVDIRVRGRASSTMIKMRLGKVSVLHFALLLSFSIVVSFPPSYASRRQFRAPPLRLSSLLVFSSCRTFADVGVCPSIR